jgi:hypothetical protein
LQGCQVYKNLKSQIGYKNFQKGKILKKIKKVKIVMQK